MFKRGDKIRYKGVDGNVLFAYPNGTNDYMLPWAKIKLIGLSFVCVPMIELEERK